MQENIYRKYLLQENIYYKKIFITRKYLLQENIYNFYYISTIIFFTLVISNL